MDKEHKIKVQNWMKENQIIKVDFDLIIEALTHSSYKGMGYNVKDNERLEFLGDSVLDLVIAHILFEDPQLSEGIMTENRKDLVNNETLSKLFDKTGLSYLIRTAKDFIISEKTKASFIEAIFGAIFLSKGYNRCVELWEIFKCINEVEYESSLDEENEVNRDDEHQNNELIIENDSNASFGLRYYGDPHKNAKNVLQEYCQKNFSPIPQYILKDQIGPDHRPQFTVDVIINIINLNGEKEIRNSEGKGFSKKEAEFKAAEKLCKELSLTYKPS